MSDDISKAAARTRDAAPLPHSFLHLRCIGAGTAGSAGTTPLSRFTAWDYLSPPARPGADPMRVQRVRVKRAGVLMTTFLDNWEDSNCWDVHAPDSEGEGEAVARDVLRAVASAKGLPAKPEPLVLGAGALLALLGISVRYIKSLEEAERAVETLVDEAGHIGIDIETAKLTRY